MSLDKENTCGCGGNCGQEEEEHVHGGCSDEGCGCGHDHEHNSITLTLEDDLELDCPIIDAFEINEQEYIALLHPVDETVLLYRFYENEDESIDLETIDSDEEFDLVSKTFLALQED